MRELAILTFLTLDGVMQAPGSPDEDASGGFTQGGWARGCWEEVMEQVMREAMSVPYDLLLGRKTYEIFTSAFSNAGDDNGDDNPVHTLLNRATKYVVTNSLSDFAWQNSVGISGDVVTEVSKLKAQDGPLLQVHGSWQLIQTLLAHDLIDEFRLWTFPVVVGSGKRLLENGTKPTHLNLIKTDSCPSGAVMQFYRQA